MNCNLTVEEAELIALNLFNEFMSQDVLNSPSAFKAVRPEHEEFDWGYVIVLEATRFPHDRKRDDFKLSEISKMLLVDRKDGRFMFYGSFGLTRSLEWLIKHGKGGDGFDKTMNDIRRSRGLPEIAIEISEGE